MTTSDTPAIDHSDLDSSNLDSSSASPKKAKTKDPIVWLVDNGISLLIVFIVSFIAVSFSIKYLERELQGVFTNASTTASGDTSALHPLNSESKEAEITPEDPDNSSNSELILGYPKDAVVRIYPGLGRWYAWDNGQRIDLEQEEDLQKLSSKPQALLLHESREPKINNLLDDLPTFLPLLVQGESGVIGSLEYRGRRNLNLVIKPFNVSVGLVDELFDALWFWQRPITKIQAQVLSIHEEWGQRLQKENALDPYQPRDVGLLWLTPSLEKLSSQTVLISGDIDGDTMYFHNKGGSDEQSILLSTLRGAARSGIILILVDTPLDHLSETQERLTELAKANPSFLEMHNQFLPKGFQKERVYVRTERSRGYEFRADWSSERYASTVASGRDFGVEGVHVYMPPRRLVEEYEGRLVKGVPQPLQNFVLFSIFFGILCRNTSWRAWNGFWKGKNKPKKNQSYFSFGFFWLFHKAFYIGVFLPLFGCVIFFCSIWITLFDYFNWFIIKPIKWIFGKLRAE